MWARKVYFIKRSLKSTGGLTTSNDENFSAALRGAR